MNRRTIILYLSALAVMILGIVVAVALLYSEDEGRSDREGKPMVAENDRCHVLCAIPSDAVLVQT